jgi:hypothetical protein
MPTVAPSAIASPVHLSQCCPLVSLKHVDAGDLLHLHTRGHATSAAFNCVFFHSHVDHSKSKLLKLKKLDELVGFVATLVLRRLITLVLRWIYGHFSFQGRPVTISLVDPWSPSLLSQISIYISP